MDEPKPIAEVVEEAMARILGPDVDSYNVLCEQTIANRERIEQETRAQFNQFFAQVVGERAAMQRNPERLRIEASMEAQRRVQLLLGKRLSDEDQRFRAACQALFAWAEETKRGGCQGCG